MSSKSGGRLRGRSNGIIADYLKSVTFEDATARDQSIRIDPELPDDAHLSLRAALITRFSSVSTFAPQWLGGAVWAFRKATVFCLFKRRGP